MQRIAYYNIIAHVGRLTVNIYTAQTFVVKCMHTCITRISNQYKQASCTYYFSQTIVFSIARVVIQWTL